MKTLKTIKIFLFSIIRFILPTSIRLLKYIIFVLLLTVLVEKSNTNLIKVIFNWTYGILRSLINTPIILYKQDRLAGLVIGIIILAIISGIIFSKNSKFRVIGEDIKNILGDLVFSFIYLISILIEIIKNRDLSALDESISFYFKTGTIRGVNYFKLNALEKKLLRSGSGFNINLYDRINSYFKTKYNCSVTSFVDSNDSKIIKLRRPQDMKGNEFMRLNKQDILFTLGYNIEKYGLEVSVGNEIELIFIVKNTDKILNINDFINSFKTDTYNFGMDSMGNLVSFPINYSHANHLGIYGQTGHGKSVFTSQLIYGLFRKNNYNYYITDPKGDFYWAKGVKNISYAKDIKEIINLVSRIGMNIEKTQAEFNNKQVRNLDEYLKLDTKDRLDFIKPTFIFIEEFSYLLDLIGDLGKDEKESFLADIKNIVQVGRSSGYSLILSLQKPISEAIGSTIVKDMIKPISFRATGSGEVIAFGEKTGLELDKLEIGEAVYFDSGKYKKFKSFYIDKSDLDRLRIDYKDDEENITDRYFKYSKELNSFKLEEALQFGLSRSQFDALSKNLQEKGIIVKSSNNHLHYSK